MTDPERCPCDTGRPYAACCGPLHAGRPAATAVALMRSRYSAFALGLVDHLLATWHPSTRPARLSLDPTMTWTGLEIEAVTGGQAWADDGTVRFTAHLTTPRRPEVLRETSRFAMLDGRWVYVDGTIHRGRS